MNALKRLRRELLEALEEVTEEAPPHPDPVAAALREEISVGDLVRQLLQKPDETP